MIAIGSPLLSCSFMPTFRLGVPLSSDFHFPRFIGLVSLHGGLLAYARHYLLSNQLIEVDCRLLSSYQSHRIEPCPSPSEEKVKAVQILSETEY
ncbi:hypothetical protein SUGI_0131020 [Cryptomeria japonica]|nr:hypothetical protein SUGI_0131020 [Cryptomeria japonica]